MLFFPVLTSSHPRSLSSALSLRVLCDLCVKITPSRDFYRSPAPKTSARSGPASPPQTARICTSLHRNPNSPLLFSITCEQFCNYEGVGGWGRRFSYFQFRVSFLDLLYLLSLPLLQTLPFSVSRKSFLCHSYANCRVSTSLPKLERACLCKPTLRPSSKRHQFLSPLTTRHFPSHQSPATSHSLPITPRWPPITDRAIVLTAGGSF